MLWYNHIYLNCFLRWAMGPMSLLLFYPMSQWERLAVCIYMCVLVLYLLLFCCLFIEVQWMGGTQSTEHCPSPQREMWRGPTSSVSTVCLTCVKRTHLSYTPVNICKILTCMPFYYLFFKKRPKSVILSLQRTVYMQLYARQ